MRLRFRAAVALCILGVATAREIRAQDAVRFEPGLYELVPDSSYSADFDLAGMLVEFTATTMTASQSGNLIAKSTISYGGDVMTITDLDGMHMCPSPAKYRVSKTPKGLRLSAIEEPCGEPSAVLGAITFVKKM